MPVKAYAAQSADSGVAPWELERRTPKAEDISIDIMFCGVCHTDVHFAANDWGVTRYPLVPGHEIIGRVTAVGPNVSQYKPGDVVGVGCMVDSCRECSSCKQGLENYCAEGMTGTYNGVDRNDGSDTYGGYSEHIVVPERYVVKVPNELDPAAAAPLLCAGITTYSPLNHLGVGKGHKVGVVGMGGLGHMGIKFAKAMGAEVTLFTRSGKKVEEAKRNGADRVVISADKEQMQEAVETLDFVLDTVPVEHDFNPYLQALKLDGTYIIVGQLTPIEPAIQSRQLVRRRRKMMGSLIGGMPETQEVLDFCAKTGVRCDIEMLDIRNINEAYERMKKGDVRYRFVIDINTLK